MITALCGGVGGSKLVQGLYRILSPDELAIIVNTADDLDFCGLHVSPDLDTVMYTLAGLSRQDVGWGIEGDTFTALEMLTRYGAPAWFSVGDRDMATDVFRTCALRAGEPLSVVTETMRTGLGVHARILPMTDDPVSTRLLAGDEWLDFQDYFVRRRHQVPVSAVRYDGILDARPTEEALNALRNAEVVIMANSNPLLSIMPILSLPGVRDTLTDTSARRVAVSPMVGSDSVTGPAGDLMRLAGQTPTSVGVAHVYRDFLDGMVIHEKDREHEHEIESLGVSVLCTDTIMRTIEDRERVAAETLDFARGLA